MSWHNRVLHVDLTNHTSRVEPLNEQWKADYLGSRGLASKYLMEMMDPAADPLSPDNVLIFATGPLTGTMASTGGRYAVVTKGPLTNAIACSNSGGKFGAELKLAGFDLLILEGRSETPVYLLIQDDTVQILPAQEYWGKTVWHTEETLKSAHQDPQIKVASIGVAGEAGVKYACVVNDLHRAAGRSGVGAVMGFKALEGNRGDEVRKVCLLTMPPDSWMWSSKRMNFWFNDEGRKGLTNYGTNAMIDTMNAFGGLPTRNFQEVSFEGSEKINPAAMSAVNENGHQNLITNKACFGCTIGCGRIAHIDKKSLGNPRTP